MKRFLIIFIAFLLLFVILALTSCELGTDEFVICKGFWGNEWIKSCTIFMDETDILESYGQPEITIIEDNGKNGYITIEFTAPEEMKNNTVEFYRYESELEVFDGDTLVGRAAIRKQYEYGRYASYIFGTESIIINDYISGDYSFVVHSFTAWI